MLDNLRDQTSSTPFFQEEKPAPKKPDKLDKPKPPPSPRRSLDQLTGMTAPQRFFLALMLLMIVCLLGIALLVLTGKVVPLIVY